MGYLSCKAESAVTTCDSYYNKEKQLIRNHTKPAKLRRFRYEELESATGGFSPETFLGKGSHGWVYKAVLDAGTLVAAVKKTTTATHQEDGDKNIQNTNNNNNPGENEIEILSRIRNPYLVNLLGYSVDSHENKKLIVVEFMANGSLYDHLHSNLRRPPGWAKRIRYALQIAIAVESLHSANPPVIHRDIKSSNVLIDENWNARLGDFGLALRGHVEDVRIRSTPPAGTLGYLDPGYITPENLSTKSDVFSFGILLLEIVSGRNAIDVNFSPPSLIDWAVPIIKIGDYTAIYDPRIGPPEDLSVMRQLAVLAARCVRFRVDKRPSMVEVVNCLRAVSKRVPLPIWNNLAKRMRKTSLITGSKSEFETVKEVSVAFKPVSRNPLRSRKVSNLQSGIVDFIEEPTIRVLNHGGCARSIGSVNELKVELHSKVAESPALVRRVDLAVRMPRVKLINSRSMGVSRNGHLVHDGERGHVLKMVKNPHVRGMDTSRLVINVEKTKTQQRRCHQRTESF